MSKLMEIINQGPISYDAERKEVFKRAGRSFLKKVLSNLSGVVESRVDYNKGGIAVSGDHSLYVMFEDGRGACVFFNNDGMCDFVTMRSINALDDYSGGANQNFPMSILSDEAEVARQLEGIAGV